MKRKLPHLAHFPVLLRAFVENPLRGNLWHADHVIPVALGGGEATLSNLQTLCVACHMLKTQEDLKAIRADGARAGPESASNECSSTTTLAIAVAKLETKKQIHRVTRRP